MSPDERAHNLSPSDKFDMIGHAKGITGADKQYFAGHPDELDRIRLVSADDVEAPAGTTHVQILEHVDFNGNRTGYRNRAFLRRLGREA
jgi:hypothetical protein